MSAIWWVSRSRILCCAVGCAATRMGNWRKKLVLAEIHFVFRVKIHRWSLNLRYTIGRPVRHVTHRCGVRNGADRVLTWIESYVGYVKAVRLKRVTGLKSRYYVIGKHNIFRTTCLARLLRERYGVLYLVAELCFLSKIDLGFREARREDNWIDADVKSYFDPLRVTDASSKSSHPFRRNGMRKREATRPFFRMKAATALPSHVFGFSKPR